MRLDNHLPYPVPNPQKSATGKAEAIGNLADSKREAKALAASMMTDLHKRSAELQAKSQEKQTVSEPQKKLKSLHEMMSIFAASGKRSRGVDQKYGQLVNLLMKATLGDQDVTEEEIAALMRQLKALMAKAKREDDDEEQEEKRDKDKPETLTSERVESFFERKSAEMMREMGLITSSLAGEESMARSKSALAKKAE